MAIPTTRQQFIDTCLRKLGAPVIDINVDNDQVDDRVDEALQYFRDYHYDGTEKTFIKHIITAEDKANGYFTVDEDITGIINIFPLGDGTSTSNMFSMTYQISLNDLAWNTSSGSLTHYYLAKQHIAHMQELMAGQVPFRFNRHRDRIHVDMDWSSVATGSYIVLEAYQTVDPTVYTDVWSDRWLLRYTTALIKQQWGENISKFEGVQMPGGITFNGRQILDDANGDIEKLESEMMDSFSLPVHDMMG